MKMRMFSRVFPAVMAALLLAGAASAEDAAVGEETVSPDAAVTESVREQTDGIISSGEEEQPTPSEHTYSRFADSYFPTSTDFAYELFQQTVDLYVKEHLYDFSREYVMDKFIYDLIDEHPELYELMLNTVLGTMDPYSAFHAADDGFLSVKSDSVGFGITVNDTGGQNVIASVLPGSTAEATGILPGDVIVGVIGRDVASLPWNAVSYLVKTPYAYTGVPMENGRYTDYNPVIDLTVERNGERLTFSLQKGVMIENPLSVQINTEKGIATIGIAAFIGDTFETDFDALIGELVGRGIEKLTFDLRGNGGGSLDIALHVAEYFTEKGDVMCYIGTKHSEQPEPVTSTTERVPFGSISVLIDENTASAAELLASILRNRAGAKLIGHCSYGKALGQKNYMLRTGDSVTITTFEIFDANGESYNEIGLVPDIEMDNVELLYRFPQNLAIFNHQNYFGIDDGAYHDACLALEQRYEILGLLRNADVDGVWTENTTTATVIYQTRFKCGGDSIGKLNDATVTSITNIINGYKDQTYFEDSMLDVATIAHSSFSQAKRLCEEKKTLAKREKKLIEENRAWLEAWYDENM